MKIKSTKRTVRQLPHPTPQQGIQPSHISDNQKLVTRQNENLQELRYQSNHQRFLNKRVQTKRGRLVEWYGILRHVLQPASWPEQLLQNFDFVRSSSSIAKANAKGWSRVYSHVTHVSSMLSGSITAGLRGSKHENKQPNVLQFKVMPYSDKNSGAKSLVPAQRLSNVRYAIFNRPHQ